MKKVVFKRRHTLDIENVPLVDGQLIYDIDTGETYMDVEDSSGVRRIKTGGGTEEAVLYVTQDLSQNQQSVARENIGAASQDDITTEIGKLDNVYFKKSSLAGAPGVSEEMVMTQKATTDELNKKAAKTILKEW